MLLKERHFSVCKLRLAFQNSSQVPSWEIADGVSNGCKIDARLPTRFLLIDWISFFSFFFNFSHKLWFLNYAGGRVFFFFASESSNILSKSLPLIRSIRSVFFPKKNLQFIFNRWTMSWRLIIIIIIIIMFFFISVNLSLVSCVLGMIYSILRPTKCLKSA